MEFWQGASAVCVNDQRQLLMVKQGTPEEVKTWALPGGGKNKDETIEECCVREVWEETGYIARAIRELHVKHTQIEPFRVQVHYILIEIVGGNINIQDPDDLIERVEWIDVSTLRDLSLSYEEDRKGLVSFLKSGGNIVAE